MTPMTDEEYWKLVWNKADATDLYKDILDDLINDKDNPYKADIITAKSDDDYARIVIGTNFLGKYIVQLVNDMISLIWDQQWWEESCDEIREAIGLKLLNRYKK